MLKYAKRQSVKYNRKLAQLYAKTIIDFYDLEKKGNFNLDTHNAETLKQYLSLYEDHLFNYRRDDLEPDEITALNWSLVNLKLAFRARFNAINDMRAFF